MGNSAIPNEGSLQNHLGTSSLELGRFLMEQVKRAAFEWATIEPSGAPALSRRRFRPERSHSTTG